MRRAKFWSAAAVLAATLSVPGPASAGLIDFIWEMSGPQMMGVMLVCGFDLQKEQHQCRLLDGKIGGGDKLEDPLKFEKTRRLWLNLGTGYYFATGWTDKYDKWAVSMLVHEPMLHVKSISRAKGDFAIEHGVAGLSQLVFWGERFKRFSNTGFKFIPTAIRYKRFTAEYIVRFYPAGFTDHKFGIPGSVPEDRKPEVVPSFGFGYLW